jgi:hypothetical protein
MLKYNIVTCLGSLSLSITSFWHQCNVYGFFWHQLVTCLGFHDKWLMWTPGFDDEVYSTTYAASLLHFTSHTKSLLLSVFSALSSHADWTWLGPLGLTAHAECWLLTAGITALVWTRHLVAYYLLLWSLHVSGLTASAECWLLTANSRPLMTVEIYPLK